jgi:serine/threonine protein kinase
MSRPLEEIQDEILEQLHAGEPVDREGLLLAHPQHELALKRFFAVVDVIERSPYPRRGDTLPGGRLGDFEIVRERGRGGMGVVYEARQISLNRNVALKVLPPGLRSDRRLLKRFRREAEAAARLRHPGIVPVYSIGESAGAPFFAMELVEGRSLADVLKARHHDEPTGLPEDAGAWRRWVVTIVARVADALAYAHGQGILHRDVKPANILLESDGTPRLTDFGLALDMAATGLTLTGEVFGSPLYMSPEQALHAEVPVDARTDVYSLAVTLYELLTSKLPYIGNSHAAVMTALSSGTIVPPRDVDPSMPEKLETVVLRALQHEPGERYASAEAFAADLRACLDEHTPLSTSRPADVATIEPAQPAPAHAASKRKDKTFAGVVGGVVGSLIGKSIVTVSVGSGLKDVDKVLAGLLEDDEDEPADPEAQLRSWNRVLVGALVVVVLGFFAFVIYAIERHNEVQQLNDLYDDQDQAEHSAELRALAEQHQLELQAERDRLLGTSAAQREGAHAGADEAAQLEGPGDAAEPAGADLEVTSGARVDLHFDPKPGAHWFEPGLCQAYVTVHTPAADDRTVQLRCEYTVTNVNGEKTTHYPVDRFVQPTGAEQATALFFMHYSTLLGSFDNPFAPVDVEVNLSWRLVSESAEEMWRIQMDPQLEFSGPASDWSSLSAAKRVRIQNTSPALPHGIPGDDQQLAETQAAFQVTTLRYTGVREWLGRRFAAFQVRFPDHAGHLDAAFRMHISAMSEGASGEAAPAGRGWTGEFVLPAAAPLDGPHEIVVLFEPERQGDDDVDFATALGELLLSDLEHLDVVLAASQEITQEISDFETYWQPEGWLFMPPVRVTGLK